MTGAAQMTSSTQPDRAELLLRVSRRSLFVLLALVLLFAATIIAHVLRPGSLLADWASRAPWLLTFVVLGVILILNAPLRRPFRAADPEMKQMLNDAFRQAQLARAQRAALVAVVLAQIPLAVLVSTVSTVAAVTVMGVGTVAVAMTTLIASFLFFDRD